MVSFSPDPFQQLEMWQLLTMGLVLLASLYMLLDTVRWQIRLHQRNKALCRLTSEGEELRQRLLAACDSKDGKEIADAIESWIKATTSMLEIYSAEAARFFERMSSPGASALEMLNQRIDNLQAISERPDIYYS